jgi:hypothetical protein
MTDLPRHARFIGPDRRTIYRVTTAAADHERGWVMVRNLSMTDAQAAAAVAAGGFERGDDPRDEFFAFSAPVEVEVLP